MLCLEGVKLLSQKECPGLLQVGQCKDQVGTPYIAPWLPITRCKQLYPTHVALHDGAMIDSRLHVLSRRLCSCVMFAQLLLAPNSPGNPDVDEVNKPVGAGVRRGAGSAVVQWWPAAHCTAGEPPSAAASHHPPVWTPTSAKARTQGHREFMPSGTGSLCVQKHSLRLAKTEAMLLLVRTRDCDNQCNACRAEHT